MQRLTIERKIDVPDFGTRLTIDELKSLVTSAGSHFFDRGSMKFFNSRVNSEVWAVSDGWIFLTSEQFQPSQGPAEKRKYTIRKVVIQDGDLYITEPEGHTDGFQKYFSTSEAKRAIRRMVAESQEAQQ